MKNFVKANGAMRLAIPTTVAKLDGNFDAADAHDGHIHVADEAAQVRRERSV
jgi:hypothetical protein